jgi:hypothetical protein
MDYDVKMRWKYCGEREKIGCDVFVVKIVK